MIEHWRNEATSPCGSQMMQSHLESQRQPGCVVLRGSSPITRSKPLTLRIVFKLPLRQVEGFLRSLLSLMNVDLEAPDHTTLSRRSQSLNVDLRRVAGDGPIHLIVDSTGRSIVGEAEWVAASGRGKRNTITRPESRTPSISTKQSLATNSVLVIQIRR
jgi:hypothetical protein